MKAMCNYEKVILSDLVNFLEVYVFIWTDVVCINTQTDCSAASVDGNDYWICGLLSQSLKRLVLKIGLVVHGSMRSCADDMGKGCVTYCAQTGSLS